MRTDIWLFEEPPRRLSQIKRRSCQLQRELEHWLFLPTLSMSQLSKNGATLKPKKLSFYDDFQESKHCPAVLKIMDFLNSSLVIEIFLQWSGYDN